MHICVVGTGASGWMTAHALAKLNKVTKVTIVGSDKIPTIGVGESTTLNFMAFLKDTFGYNLNYPCKHSLKFLVDVDAAIKFGVYYDKWSDNSFLHEFGGRLILERHRQLGKKPKGESVNEYISDMTKYVFNNHLYLRPYAIGEDDDENIKLNVNYLICAIHFDANMFIKTMQNLAKDNSKIEHVVGTAIDLLYEQEDAKTLVLEDGRKIDADYFVSCIGQTAFNQKVFREEYQWYGDILLTNRAVAGPMEYTDKRKQFHPYTVARAMKNGWRWITPTWSRVGTGYVFSNNHVSDDEAIHEFLENVGDRNFKIDPFIVDFTPRKAVNSFKKNTCTIGMAAGFVEPLDAPGLSLTANAITQLQTILIGKQTIEKANEFMDWSYKLWVAFVLNQYKTASRNDTKFWQDAKNVNFPIYDEIFAWITNKTTKLPEGVPGGKMNIPIWEPNMFWMTTAGKDVQWDVDSDLPLMKPAPVGVDGGHHLDYFEGIRQLFG